VCRCPTRRRAAPCHRRNRGCCPGGRDLGRSLNGSASVKVSYVVGCRGEGASGGAGPAVAREFAQRGDAVALLAPGEAGLQGAGFVLAVDGMIVTAVYSFGAIGRLMADDVVGLVCYIKQQP